MHGYFPPEPPRPRRPFKLTAAGIGLGCLLLLGPLSLGIGGSIAIAIQLHSPLVKGNSLIPLLGACLVVGLYAVIFAVSFAFSPQRKVPRLDALPLRPLSACADGEVAMVQGTLLPAPDSSKTEWTKRRCVWSELRLTPFESRPKGRITQDPVVRPRTDTFRILCDGSEIQVHGAGALVRGEPRKKEDAYLIGLRGEEVRALLVADGVEMKGTDGAEIEERWAVEGEAVIVVGVVRRGEAYRDGLQLTSGSKDRLMVTTETREALLRALAAGRSRRPVLIALLVAMASAAAAYGCVQGMRGF